MLAWRVSGFFSSVQFSCSVISDTLWGSMNCSMPGSSALHCFPEFAQIHVHWVSDASNHLIFCSPLLLCLQSFPASGSFPMNQLFTSDGQSIRASASASVFPINIQDWFLLGWIGLISLLSQGLKRVFSNTAVQKHQFFGAQPSLWSNSHIHTWLWKNHSLDFVGQVMSLLFNMLSRLS